MSAGLMSSSVAAIMNSTVQKPHVYVKGLEFALASLNVRYTEKEWNTQSPKEIEEKGKAAEAGDKYRSWRRDKYSTTMLIPIASKTLAERAFWKFIEDEKPSWDGATINPPLVGGFKTRK